MKLMVINPNTTASMTDAIGRTATAIAAAGTEVRAWNPSDGPPSIEGHHDGAYAAVAMLDGIRMGERSGTDGYVIACFDDTGLDAARELAAGPVVGIGEAAMHMAALICSRFSIVTTLARSVPILRHNVHRYGMERHCASVRAADIPVLSLEGGGAAVEGAIREQMRAALQDDGAECLLLGCAGMTHLSERLTTELKVPVIDGVRAGVKLVEALVGAGLGTAKRGGYAHPEPKTYTGAWRGVSPAVPR